MNTAGHLLMQCNTGSRDIMAQSYVSKEEKIRCQKTKIIFGDELNFFVY